MLVPAAAFAAVTCVWALATRRAVLSSLGHVPGPPYSFILGTRASWRELRDEQHELLRRVHTVYGHVAKLVLPFGAGVLVLCSRRAAAEPQLLADHRAFARRAPGVDLPLSLGARALDARWRACRAALVLALSPAALCAHYPAFSAHAAHLRRRLARAIAPPAAGGGAARDDPGRAREQRGACNAEAEVEVSAPIKAVVLVSLAQLTLGASAVERTELAELARAVDGVVLGASRSRWLPAAIVRLLDGLPASARPRYRLDAARGLDALARLTGEAYDAALERDGAIGARERGGLGRGGSGGGGLAKGGLAGAGSDADGVPREAVAAMDSAARAQADVREPRAVIDELARARVPRDTAGQIAAEALSHGHAAIAHALCSALHLLASHPHEQKAVCAELREVCGGALRQPTLDELRGLRLLRGTWLEALRLCPPIAATCRVAARDAHVDGVHLPRGTRVLYSIASAARDERVFGPDVERFRPERHLDDATPLLGSDGGSWLPFGAGVRRCAGIRLAEQLGLSLLAAVIVGFELVPPDRADELPAAGTANGALCPASAQHVRLRAR